MGRRSIRLGAGSSKPPDEFLTLAAVAKVLGIGKKAVQYHVTKGSLPASRSGPWSGKQWVIKDTDLQAWIGRRARERERLPRNQFERDFEDWLKSHKRSTSTIQHAMTTVRAFLRHVGNQPLHRLSEDLVRSFFSSRTRRQHEASVVSAFLRFTAARLPVPLTDRGSELAPVPRARSKKERGLEQLWLIDKLTQQKRDADELIAKLAGKVVDFYVFLQARIKGEAENLDDLYRLRDECGELIQGNLALFMQLSAQGKNVHSKIDERIIQP